MWIVRWTLIGIMIIIILGFALQNTENMVSITIWDWRSGEIPVYLVIYVAFAAGMLVFLLATAVYQIQHATELRRCRREIRRLQEELDRMRTISLEEGIDETSDQAGTEAGA